MILYSASDDGMIVRKIIFSMVRLNILLAILMKFHFLCLHFYTLFSFKLEFCLYLMINGRTIVKLIIIILHHILNVIRKKSKSETQERISLKFILKKINEKNMHTSKLKMIKCYTIYITHPHINE